MKVSRAATLKIESVSPMASTYEIARQMAIKDIGFLPVIERGELKGVVTDRDVVVRCIAENRDPLHTDAYDIMTRPAAWIYADAELDAAALEMERRNVRRLVVKDRLNACIGVVSLDDIARVKSNQAGRVLDKVAYRAPASVGGRMSDFDAEE